MMVAVSLAVLVTSFVVYVILASSRVVSIVTRQSLYQQSASLLMDKVSDILRNAVQRSFEIPKGSILLFSQKSTPDDTSEISLDSTKGIVYFYPDVDSKSDKEALAKNIETLDFKFTSAAMIEVTVKFHYPKYGKIFSADKADQQLGTYKTTIFPRQDNIETIY
jgi:hypothetical protein